VDTATLRLSLVPFQVKTVSAGQLAADQHVVVVTVSFDASNWVFNSNQVVVFIVLVMAFFSQCLPLITGIGQFAMKQAYSFKTLVLKPELQRVPTITNNPLQLTIEVVANPELVTISI
jgi:hypothetical protein